jgi:hypothetical protein
LTARRSGAVVQRRFTVDRMVDEYLAVYDRVQAP